MITKPSPDDPLYILYDALEQAQFGRRVTLLLDRVQRIDETDEQTIIRLIQERLNIANILKDFSIGREQFDDTYRNNDISEDLAKLLERLKTRRHEYSINIVEKVRKR